MANGQIYWRYDQQLDLQNRKIDQEKELHNPRNIALIRRYQGYALTNQVSQVRVAKLTCGLRELSKTLGKPFDEATRQDIEHMLAVVLNRKIRGGRPLSLNTQRDYKRVVKQFYRWLAGQEEYEHDANMSRLVSYLRKEVKTPDPKRVHDPGNILTDQDVQKVIDTGCASELERALLVTLYETGCRVGELLNVRICDVSEEGDLWAMRVYGKTGERTVPVVYSIPHLIRWMAVHPDRQNPNAYLWINPAANKWGKPMNYPVARGLINRCFTRANVLKRNNPHWWRHSRCTHDAKDNSYTDSILCAKMGHGPKVAARYRHMSAQDVKDAARRSAGLQVREDSMKRPLLPLQCRGCLEVNPHSAQYCAKCGKPLSVKVVVEEQQWTEKAFELLAKIMRDPVLRAEYERTLQVPDAVRST